MTASTTTRTRTITIPGFLAHEKGKETGMFVKLIRGVSQHLWQADSVEWGVLVCNRPPSQIEDWPLFVAGNGADNVRTAQIVHAELDDEDWQYLQKTAGSGRPLPLAMIGRWVFLEPDRRLIVTAGDGELYVMTDNGKTIDRIR